MFTIKISKEILKDLLKECMKTGERFGIMEIHPASFYVKDDCVINKYSPAVSVVLDDTGEISTTIRANYNTKTDSEPESEPDSEKKVVSEAISTVNETIKKHIITTFKRLDKNRQVELLKDLNRELEDLNRQSTADDFLSEIKTRHFDSHFNNED